MSLFNSYFVPIDYEVWSISGLDNVLQMIVRMKKHLHTDGVHIYFKLFLHIYPEKNLTYELVRLFTFQNLFIPTVVCK